MSSILWKQVLDTLEATTSRPNFITWIKPTDLLELKNNLARISIPNHYAKNWIEKNATKQLLLALQQHHPEIENIELVLVEPEPKKDYTELPLLSNQLEVEQSETEGVAKKNVEVPSFNSRYTFENFIVGNNNRLAFAASQAVAEKLGQAYNPLFIYGGVGLGKTHLMHAIGNRVLEGSPKKKIIYISCETFTGEFINALQTKTITEFKRKYRTADVLLIDDIQFLANKEGTQEEFFHTFNILHQANRQIVLTSDRVPKEMTELEDRLISRFGWGMIADIQSPNFETRTAILQSKAEEKGITVPQEVLEYIANTITSNVRELEGSLIKLHTASLVEGEEITREFAQRVLKDLLQQPSGVISSKKVLRVVATYFNLEESDLLGSKRIKELVYPRQLIMYFLRDKLRQSFPQIGEILGGKDHTTIMYGVTKIENQKKKDPTVEKDIKNILNLLYE
jgi:chromosomal replication initiator protein